LPAAVGSIDNNGGSRRWRAAEGGGGSSVDVLGVLIMCGSYSRNSTKAEI
jgi:hypothetical protein